MEVETGICFIKKIQRLNQSYLITDSSCNTYNLNEGAGISGAVVCPDLTPTNIIIKTKASPNCKIVSREHK
jgi:hypothetical protein